MWRELSPEELAAFSGIDSHVVYEDALSTFGYLCILMGKFERAAEVPYCRTWICSCNQILSKVLIGIRLALT